MVMVEKEPMPSGIVETVRAVVTNEKGEILLLQKSEDSKNPLSYEFPGGKIDRITGAHSTDEEQKEALYEEVQGETGLDITGSEIEKICAFDYQFQHKGETYGRTVHVFSVAVHEEEVVINKHPEDKHRGYRWVQRSELHNLRRWEMLSGNSTIFEKA